MSEEDNSIEMIFATAGQMGALMAATDWRTTSLGIPENWPQSLRSSLSICLNTRFPICIYWGPEYVLLYNDAWSPIPGDKHPWALGRTAREVWPEIWDLIETQLANVLSKGQATWREDEFLPMYRRGYIEECYFNYTMSPIVGDGGLVVGIFSAGIETTYKVIDERRMGLLRTLAEGTAAAKSAEDVCQLSATILGGGAKDVSFCLIYLIGRDDNCLKANLAAVTGLSRSRFVCPPVIDLSEQGGPPPIWPLDRVLRMRSPEVVEALEARFAYPMPGGAWPEPARCALVTAIPGTISAEAPAGFLIVGLSPRRNCDEQYRSFVQLAAQSVGTAISNANALAEAQQQAEARYARSLIEASLDPVFMISAEGNISDVNEATIQATGVPREQLIGSDFAGYFTEPVRARAGYGEVFSNCFIKKYALAIRHLSGEIIDVDFNASLYRNEKGEVAGVFAAARDITERKHAEAELRQSQQLLQSIIDNSTALIFVKDMEGRYLLINRHYTELFHLSQEAIIGRTDYDIFPHERAHAYRAVDQKVLTSGMALQAEELVPQDGETHTYLSLKYPLSDALGHPYAVCGIATDITERKQAQAAAERANHVLEQTLREVEASRELVQFQKGELMSLYDKIVAEQKVSERLLLNVLPNPIAERLKARLDHIADSLPEVIADSFQEATVLFADIVAFTRFSTGMSAERLVAMLNEIFSDFDSIADHRGLEKIKTIGDAYMAAAGLPVPAFDHAARAAHMALDMLDALERFNERNGYRLQLRIGINSGAVVAGVIGKRKFIYDLWGDAVNIASRMESHGVAGRVQVTEATRRRLGELFLFEERGTIDVKGMGALHTWFLVGRSSASSE